MAKTKISRVGFGQVEPNHLSGIVEGRMNAQRPVDITAMGKVIEQGRFAKYDPATGKVNLSGKGNWMLIYNEEQLYDERYQAHKDYAMILKDHRTTRPVTGISLGSTDPYDGQLFPRLISTEVGDIYTTNSFGPGENTLTDAYDQVFEGPSVDVGDVFVVGADGYLTLVTNPAANDAPTKDIWQVVKVYTMADGQPGVKIQRIG